MSATSSTPASRQRSITFMTSEYGQLLVGLEVDHAGALGQVLEPLLDLGQELGLVVELLRPPR